MTVNEPRADSAPRFARLAADAFEEVTKRLAPHHAQAREQALHAFLEGHEADAVALAQSVIGDIASDASLPDSARVVFDLMLQPEHQYQAVLIVLGIYPIVQGFVSAAIAPYVNDVAQLAWKGHPQLVLSPPELSLAVLKGVLTEDQAWPIAQQSGVSQENFHTMVMNAGQAIGIEQALLLYRRNQIGDAELERVVRYSDVRYDFLPDIKMLKYAPVGAAEPIMAAVKGHLDDKTAAGYLSDAGVDPTHYDWLKATAGRPPGTMEMLSLYNRGLIDYPTFEAAVQQSDIQDRWTADLFELRRYLPPPRSIVAMVRSGAIDDGYAKELFNDHGVNDKDAAIFIAEGHATKSATLHELTVAQIRAMYGDGLYTNDQAHSRLVALGYNDETAGQILELVDDSLVMKAKTQAIGHVGSLYVKYKISQSDASMELDQIGVQATVRDHLVRIWTLERQNDIKTLTLAQCQGAWHRNTMSDQEFAQRVLELGYQNQDVPQLMALAIPPSHFPDLRTVKDIPPFDTVF